MQLLAADGTTIQVNNAWRTLWEMPDGTELSNYVLSGQYNVLTDPQLREKGITPYLERAFAGQPVRIPATKYDPAELGKPGRTRWVVGTAYPLKDGEGRVQEVMLMHEDITDRVESERLLRESEERFRSLVTASSTMVWTLRAEDLARDDDLFSPMFTAQMDGEGESNGGRATIHPDDQGKVLQSLRESIARQTIYQSEYRLQRADEEYAWITAKAVPVFNADGSLREWVGANTDISETKRASLAVQASEARFRSLTEALPQMVWSTRPDGYHEYYNRKWYDFTGVPVGSTDGAEWTNIVHPDDQTMTWKVWLHSLETGEPYEVQYRLRHHSGQYRWALGRALPVRNDEGKILHWFGTCTDIHDQKLAEEGLRELTRRKDDFLAMLAHELRNPLAPISAAAELMERMELDPLRIKQTSRIISRQVRHLTALVDDLLDVSRVTRGLVQIEQSQQDLKLIVASALEQVTPMLEARRHRLSMDLTPESACVLGDEKRLIQVLTNLLNNAVKYTPEGGNIYLGIDVNEPWIVLRVKDDGIGMVPALQPHVFELFTQADRRADRAQGGLGIGLALVKSLVELHGGEVGCTSPGTGKGSEFFVKLPRLAPGQAAVSPAALGRLPITKNPLKILVVDDNADAAAMLAMYLNAVGHDAQVEHTPSAGLAKAGAWLPDVCILDIGLPEMDGYELALRLQEQLGTSQTALIAVSGYGQAHDKHRSIEAGFSFHLVKPVETTELIVTLASI
jgi:PAS domain S-box-containing protein